MTGYRSKKAMSDSRFAVLYEDPDYELEDEDEEVPFDPDEGELSPYGTVNS